MYKFHVDDKTFVLMRETIESYPNTLLAKGIQNPNFKDKYIKISGNDIYIDRNPESFKYVIDRLRNYEINLDSITDEFFKRRVIDDLDYFDLFCPFDDSSVDIKINNLKPEINDFLFPDKIPECLDEINDSTPNPIDLMMKLSTNEELINSLKTQKKDEDTSSGSLDLSDDEDYELV
jgi:hypothetical protein